MRRERILTRLRQLGPGPAALFEDMCRLVDHDLQLANRSMLISHLFRELESSIRSILLPDEERQPRTESEGSGHKDAVKAILDAYGIPQKSAAGKAWLKEPGNQHRYAHRRGLEEPREVDDQLRKRVQGLEMMLDEVLDAFDSRYLLMVDDLERLADLPEPTHDDAGRLRQDFPQNYLTWDIFFSRLDNAAWLGPLRKHRFFATVPPPDVDEEGVPVSYRRWPASAYLARVAHAAPAQVLEIAREIPDTDHPYVNLDLVDIALLLPPDKTAKLTPKIIQAARRAPDLIDPERYAGVAIRCAENDQAELALKLMTALLERPGDGSRYDEWEYGQLLDRSDPDLSDHLDLAWPAKLADLLQQAISARADDRTWHERHSFPQSLEEDPARAYRTQEAQLAKALRDSSRRLLTDDRVGLPAMLDVLASHDGLIFLRLRLHLLEHHGHLAPDLVADALTDPQLIQGDGWEREWLRLARAHAEHLEPEPREALIDAIRQGPNLEPWKTAYRPAADEEIPDDLLEKWTNAWRRDRYAALGSILPAALRTELDRIQAEQGPPASLDEAEETTGGLWGPPDSVTSEELAALAPAALVARIETFTPSGSGITGPSEDDYAMQVQAAVATRATAYIAHAPVFASLDDPYLKAVLAGFTDAAVQGEPLDWEQLTTLAATAAHHSANPETGAVHHHAARLLHAALTRTADRPAPTLAEDIWHTLLTVLTSPDPDTETGDRSLYRDDPRAQALRAMVAWARWRFSHDADSQRLFDLLNKITGTEPLTGPAGPDLTAAVVGECFPHLAHLDPTWAENNLTQLAGPGPLALTAWQAYLQAAPTSSLTDEFLVATYRTRARTRTEDGSDRQAVLRLSMGSHILGLLCRGVVDVGGDDRLVADYYDHTSPDTLRLLAWNVADELRRDAPADEDVIARLRAWWQWRTDDLIDRAPDLTGAERDELAVTGTLTASGRFSLPWCLERLHAVLQATGDFGADTKVFRFLAAAATQETRLVLELLQAWITSPNLSKWRPSVHEADIRTILLTGLQTPENVPLTRAIINRAAALG